MGTEISGNFVQETLDVGCRNWCRNRIRDCVCSKNQCRYAKNFTGHELKSIADREDIQLLDVSLTLDNLQLICL